MYEIECGNCGKIFARKDALCEDWRTPSKACICPGCKLGLAELKGFDFFREKGQLSKFGVQIVLTSFGTAFFSFAFTRLPWLYASAMLIPFGAVCFAIGHTVKKHSRPVKLHAFNTKS